MSINESSRPEASELPSICSPLVIWGAVALVVAIVFCTVTNSAMVLGAGYFAKLLAILVGALFGWIGAMIGDAVGRLFLPDAVFTSGGLLQLVRLKLFWKIGPQSIGVVLGVALGCVLVLR